MTDRSILIGKIVVWGGADHEWGCGRGEVLADLGDDKLFVRRIKRRDESMPDCLMIIDIVQCDPLFFDTLAQERRWYAWLDRPEPEPIVKLVPKGSKPGPEAA